MAQQTAVEWFYQRILAEDIKSVFEQAKAMEKEQIMEAWQTGFTCYEFDEMHEINRTEFSAERYYNNNYNQ